MAVCVGLGMDVPPQVMLTETLSSSPPSVVWTVGCLLGLSRHLSLNQVPALAGAADSRALSVSLAHLWHPA